MTSDDSRSRGFGFVSFEDHEAAQKVNYVSLFIYISKSHMMFLNDILMYPEDYLF